MVRASSRHIPMDSEAKRQHIKAGIGRHESLTVPQPPQALRQAILDAA